MILVSAGHYPEKPGACFGSFCEHGEAAKWARSIVELLGPDRGVLVPTGFLRDKVAFINGFEHAVAMEIHFNSDPGRVGHGCCTLYYPGSHQGKQLAEALQAAMETVYQRHADGVMEGWYRMDRKNGPDYILRQTSCPTVIIEPAFIHDQDLILSTADVACRRIAGALRAYA